MKRLQLAIDCDGILSNFTAGALRVVEEVTGRHYEEDAVGEFDFVKAIGLSVDEAREVKQIISSRRGFAASLAPYPGARQGVRRLRELGDVFCVTSPWDSNPWWRAERESWLALHFGIDRVHHEEDKSGCEADVFIDDRSKHVRAWAIAWPGRCAVLWRTMHNAGEAVPWGAHSTSSWDALYQIVKEVARGPVQPSLPLEEGSP